MTARGITGAQRLVQCWIRESSNVQPAISGLNSIGFKSVQFHSIQSSIQTSPGYVENYSNLWRRRRLQRHAKKTRDAQQQNKTTISKAYDATQKGKTLRATAGAHSEFRGLIGRNMGLVQIAWRNVEDGWEWAVREEKENNGAYWKREQKNALLRWQMGVAFFFSPSILITSLCCINGLWCEDNVANNQEKNKGKTKWKPMCLLGQDEEPWKTFFTALNTSLFVKRKRKHNNNEWTFSMEKKGADKIKGTQVFVLFCNNVFDLSY